MIKADPRRLPRAKRYRRGFFDMKKRRSRSRERFPNARGPQLLSRLKTSEDIPTRLDGGPVDTRDRAAFVSPPFPEPCPGGVWASVRNVGLYETVEHERLVESELVVVTPAHTHRNRAAEIEPSVNLLSL